MIVTRKGDIMLQVTPDWTKSYLYTASIEEDIPSLSFSGPGIYLLDNCCVLILPLLPDNKWDPEKKSIWSKKWPVETIWKVHMYNCLFHQTIFSAIAVAPCRQDGKA
jgi:hypothetical protein